MTTPYLRIMLWNVTRSKMQFLGKTLLPMSGRARKSYRIKVPKATTKGVVTCDPYTLSAEQITSILSLTRQGVLYAAVLWQRPTTSGQYVHVTWVKLQEALKDRLKELLSEKPPSATPPAVAPPAPIVEISEPAESELEEEPDTADHLDADEELGIDWDDVVEEEDEEAPAVVSAEDSSLLTVIDFELFAQIDFDLLEDAATDDSALSKVKISLLRQWGKAFDPEINGTSKSDIVEELVAQRR